jgi:flagellar protein FliO/FliZ
MTNSLTPLIWFIAVIALIPLVLWLLRRSPIGGAMASAPMRAVGMLPLSTSQRIVTVEVGVGDDRTWLVLGVTPGGIRTLHTMAPQTPAPAISPTNPQTAFAQLLTRLRQGRPDDHAR